jgi:hypothetical protein
MTVARPNGPIGDKYVCGRTTWRQDRPSALIDLVSDTTEDNGGFNKYNTL